MQTGTLVTGSTTSVNRGYRNQKVFNLKCDVGFVFNTALSLSLTKLVLNMKCECVYAL